MSGFAHLTQSAVVAIHAEVIAAHGGAPGIRDQGLLESAVAAPQATFGGTPLAPALWRLMGARVGRQCMLQTGIVSAWDCISIGDDTSIGADTQLSGVRVENGYLIIGRVDIGNRCFIGSHSNY